MMAGRCGFRYVKRRFSTDFLFIAKLDAYETSQLQGHLRGSSARAGFAENLLDCAELRNHCTSGVRFTQQAKRCRGQILGSGVMLDELRYGPLAKDNVWQSDVLGSDPSQFRLHLHEKRAAVENHHWRAEDRGLQGG